MSLSGPSAFWAVVALAANTMSHPTGKILGFRGSFDFVLRCSPVACAFDTLDTIGHLALYACTTMSLKVALQHLVQKRFGSQQANGNGTFDSLRRNVVFRLLLFFLGALPQAIKIYACEGVPWIQAIVTFYLASYVTSETFIALAALFRCAPATQLPPSLSSLRLQRLSASNGLHGVFVIALTVSSAIPIIWLPVTRPSLDAPSLPSIVTACISGALSFMLSSVVEVGDSLHSIRANVFDRMWAACFVGVHLMIAGGYYSTVYDASTTSKPGWTEWLGWE